MNRLRGARGFSHPFTLGIALDYAAMLNAYQAEYDLALAHADEASEICRRYGFVYYLAVAEIIAGWGVGLQGEVPAGLNKIRRGLDTLKSVRAEVRLPFYYGLLAEVCDRGGRQSDALANIATGLAFAGKNAEAWAAPELHRIHGDILCRSGSYMQAQASYRQAGELARRTGASLFEIRATTRLRDLPR